MSFPGMENSGVKARLGVIKEKVRLHGDESRNEQTDSWSNRDLIPLPPDRRTWSMPHLLLLSISLVKC